MRRTARSRCRLRECGVVRQLRPDASVRTPFRASGNKIHSEPSSTPMVATLSGLTTVLKEVGQNNHHLKGLTEENNRSARHCATRNGQT
jgi:hypothetical protein